MNNQNSQQIVSKDLTILNDQLGAESLLVHKYAQAAQSVTDPAIKTQLGDMSEKHRQHFNTLLSYLNSHQ